MGVFAWLVLLGALLAPQSEASAEDFAPLEVPEFSASLVRLPRGLAKAPVLVVTHGAGGTAEQHCRLWSRIIEQRAILLCLRGRARGTNPADGEYYPDHRALERETFAALSALRARYAGFSQGATMGALMLVEHAAEVTRIVLVEGGFKDWSVARARAFREHGGERVLFVCGQKVCADEARKAAYWFKLAGVPAQLQHVAGAGHSHDARVEARIVLALPWITATDVRWDGTTRPAR